LIIIALCVSTADVGVSRSQVWAGGA